MTWASAFPSAPREVAWTTIESMSPYPVSVSCTAVSGASATSSWSWRPFEPFGFSRPITWKSLPPASTVWPTGSWPGKRLLATVCPITITRR